MGLSHPAFSIRAGRAGGSGNPRPRKRISYSFGGALYAWPYYCGVAAFIQQHGLLHRGARLHGTSSGVVPASLLACGVDVERVGLPRALASNDEHVEGGRWPYLNPRAVLRSMATFSGVLPADAHRRASGRLFVVVTELPFLRKRVVSHFPTREALIDAMTASMAIPGHGVWLAYHASRAGLGWCVDGGVVDNIHDDDRAGWKTIRVGVWRSRSALLPTPERVDIYPSRRLPFKMLYTVETTENRVAWFRHGYADAARFFEGTIPEGVDRGGGRRANASPRNPSDLSKKVLTSS
jgi:hypothetical protein